MSCHFLSLLATVPPHTLNEISGVPKLSRRKATVSVLDIDFDSCHAQVNAVRRCASASSVRTEARAWPTRPTRTSVSVRSAPPGTGVKTVRKTRLRPVHILLN